VRVDAAAIADDVDDFGEDDDSEFEREDDDFVEAGPFVLDAAVDVVAVAGAT